MHHVCCMCEGRRSVGWTRLTATVSQFSTPTRYHTHPHTHTHTHTLHTLHTTHQEWIILKEEGYFKMRDRREHSWANDNMLHLNGLYEVADTVRDLSSRLAKFQIIASRNLARTYVQCMLFISTHTRLPLSLSLSLAHFVLTLRL